jgi:hypothetical protein
MSSLYAVPLIATIGTAMSRLSPMEILAVATAASYRVIREGDVPCPLHVLSVRRRRPA